MYAASLIHLPVCVYGPTGVGKTSAARAFAKIRPLSCKSNIKYKMHSFHSGTKPNNFYGTTTIKDGKIIYINGTLTDSLRKGYTFIADEMNLSSITTMKALAPALDPSAGNNIFIPGIGETVKVNSSFFFIACQNELGTIGRNAVPSSIASRFRYFDYPKQTEEDLSSICEDICNSIYKDEIKPSFKLNDIKLFRKFMIELNNSNQHCIPQWSLRDITKIFKRTFQQDQYSNRYLNITLYHNILFYSLSSVNKEDCKSCLPFICDLIGKIFFNDSTEFLTQRDELNKCFNISPEI
jgi:midasin (ATPase involved in ribosome maturation)